MKSILDDIRRSKTAMLPILEGLNFDFWKKKFTLENVKIPTNLKFSLTQIVKMSDFWASK